LISEHAPPEWEYHPYASNWTLICTGSEPIPNELLDYSNVSIELSRTGINQPNSNVLIVQMANAWSKEHLELSRDEITELILQELHPIASSWLEDAHFHAHRWRFSRPINRPTSFENDRITFAGDAWAEPIGTIEAALKSAELAAMELVWKLHYVQQTKPSTMQTTLF
jgi:predicted NAD/FAD-dependent oxidoreductase